MLDERMVKVNYANEPLEALNIERLANALVNRSLSTVYGFSGGSMRMSSTWSAVELSSIVTT